MNSSTLPIVIAAFVPLVVLVVAVVIDRKRREQTEKPPQQEKLLRPPGYSLALRLDDLQDKILNDFLLACGLCGIAGASAGVVAAFFAANFSALWKVLGALLFAAFAAFGTMAALRAFRRLNEARNIRLGLRGEQAVAETLHEVADCGFRIFHDFPAGENWNIDHIAVGTRGVFLIETKARRRRRSRNGQPEHVVTYDGKSLQFPSGDDRKAIPQAERNARWLADFLSKRTAEPVTVEPLVVLPGWYVETKGNFPVKVMNATYLAGYLRGQSEKIEPAQVRRIIVAVDDKCRDVEF
jgi:hypothetical protein